MKWQQSPLPHIKFLYRPLVVDGFLKMQFDKPLKRDCENMTDRSSRRRQIGVSAGHWHCASTASILVRLTESVNSRRNQTCIILHPLGGDTWLTATWICSVSAQNLYCCEYFCWISCVAMDLKIRSLIRSIGWSGLDPTYFGRSNM